MICQHQILKNAARETAATQLCPVQPIKSPPGTFLVLLILLVLPLRFTSFQHVDNQDFSPNAHLCRSPDQSTAGATQTGERHKAHYFLSTSDTGSWTAQEDGVRRLSASESWSLEGSGRSRFLHAAADIPLPFC